MENRSEFPNPLPGFIDEGMVKSGNRLVISQPDIIVGGEIEFKKSHESPFLQLADFAAFSIGRTQWLTSKGKFSTHDKAFLEILSERIYMPNMTNVRVNLDAMKPGDFERILKRDRRLKGLGIHPKDEA